jgi:hypothetical protein
LNDVLEVRPVAAVPLALRLATLWDGFVAGRPSESLVRHTAAELRRLHTEVHQLRNLLTTGQEVDGSPVAGDSAAGAGRIGRDGEVERLRAHIAGERARFESARGAELRSLNWSSVPDKRAASRFARAVAGRLWPKKSERPRVLAVRR